MALVAKKRRKRRLNCIVSRVVVVSLSGRYRLVESIRRIVLLMNVVVYQMSRISDENMLD